MLIYELQGKTTHPDWIR